MISSMVMWVSVTAGFSKPIPAACMYNMDDTTCFLEQKFGGVNKKTYVSKTVKNQLRERNLSFSFGLSKSKKERRHKKSKNTQARTVKLLLCTCADGTATCTVIKIKDTAIARFKMEPIDKDQNIWIVWDPKIPKGPGRQLAESKEVRVARTSCILKNAVLPAIEKDLAKKKARQLSTHSFFEDGSQHSSQDSHAADECYDRAILTMDGDFSQIEAILQDDRLTSAFRAANVELFKFAAGASMTQQPNDRSRCFYCLKKALREQKVHLHLHAETANAFIGLRHKKVLRSLASEIPDKGASKTSHATFNLFLSSCDIIFSSAFTVGNIRGGWMKCGLAPFNPQVMMESYAFFEDLEAVDPTAHQQVLAAIPKLAVLARESGCISDEQMETELGDLFGKAPDLAAVYDNPISARAPVNHRRCIWLSNPAFLGIERAHREQKIAEAATAAAAAASRAPRARNASNPRPSDRASASVSDDQWRFPCTWTSDSGVLIECGSKDRKKGQHVGSDKHKKFLKDVEVEKARNQPVQISTGENAPTDDPLAPDNLDLGLLSHALQEDEEDISSSNDEDEDERSAAGSCSSVRAVCAHRVAHACCRWLCLRK